MMRANRHMRVMALALTALCWARSGQGAEVLDEAARCVVRVGTLEAWYSGVLLSGQGHIVAARALRREAMPLRVTMALQRKGKPWTQETLTGVRVLAQHRRYALVLLQVRLPEAARCQPAVKSPQAPARGDSVVAVGNASVAGLSLEGTILRGTVAHGVPFEHAGNPYIAFTGTINRGASGGALFDDSGRLLGCLIRMPERQGKPQLAAPATALLGNRNYERLTPPATDQASAETAWALGNEWLSRFAATHGPMSERGSRLAIAAFRDALAHWGGRDARAAARLARCYAELARTNTDVPAREIGEWYAEFAVELDETAAGEAYAARAIMHQEAGEAALAERVAAVGVATAGRTAVECAIIQAQEKLAAGEREAARTLSARCAELLSALADRNPLIQARFGVLQRALTAQPDPGIGGTQGDKHCVAGNLPALPASSLQVAGLGPAGSCPIVDGEQKFLRIPMPGSFEEITGLVLSPDDAKLYVATEQSQVIRVLDARELREMGQIQVPQYPFGLARNGDKLLVACRQSKLIAVISCETDQLVDVVRLEHEPLGFGGFGPAGELGLLLTAPAERGQRCIATLYGLRTKTCHSLLEFQSLGTGAVHRQLGPVWSGSGNTWFILGAGHEGGEVDSVSRARRPVRVVAGQGPSHALRDSLYLTHSKQFVVYPNPSTHDSHALNTRSRRAHLIPGRLVALEPGADVVWTRVARRGSGDRAIANQAFLRVRVNDGAVLHAAAHKSGHDVPRSMGVMSPALQTLFCAASHSVVAFRVGPLQAGAEPAPATVAPRRVTRPSEATIGQTLRFFPVARVADDGAPYSLSMGPPGMQIDPGSGEVTWTVPDIAFGIWQVRVTHPVSGRATEDAAWMVQIRF